MNPALAQLRPYPFERLRALLAGAKPPADLTHISLSIGEPRHSPPQFVLDALTANLAGYGSYPTTAGIPQLRAAAAAWLTRRFQLPQGSVDPETMLIPVNGTREGLFAFAQAMVDAARAPLVVMPNPFYQIYEGAAFLAGAQPYFLGNDRANAYLPDLDDVPPEVWQRCQLLFLCSPSNPTGAVASIDYLRRAIALADRYDFVIASDECYSEIYLDEARPPPGLLQAAVASGHQGFERCVVFHSLSKRSSVPGLRSGFVAGDARLIQSFLQYRTYHGCALPLPTQFASIAAWNDDDHVVENRALVSREVREGIAGPARSAGSGRAARRASTCGRRCPTTNASRGSCSSVSTLRCCRAATSRAILRTAIRAAAACASRSWQPCLSASTPPNAFATIPGW